MPKARKQMLAARPTKKKPRVFICYVKPDERKAVGLYYRLLTVGADPWVDKRRLELGDDWKHEIKKAVAEADAFVVCLRPGFNETGFRQKEVKMALDALQVRPPGRGFIIPYIVEPCELPDWCEAIHAGPDLTKRTKFEDLRRAVEKHCGVKLLKAKREIRK